MDKQFLDALAQQQAFMVQQSELLKLALERLNTAPQAAANAAPNADRVENSMENLGKSISEFHFDPDNDGTFQNWYARYADLFEVDANHLEDAAKARLLIRKLDTVAHTRYVNYILPALPRDVSFDETKKFLDKIFGRQTSLFNLRYNCLKATKREGDDYIAYASMVNRACEDFKLAELNADQFKCLMFISGLNAHADADLRTKFLSLLDSDKEINLNKLTAEAIRLTTLKQDTRMVESGSSAVHQVNNNDRSSSSKGHSSKSARTAPNSPCWFCGGPHYGRDCSYKSHECSKCKNVGHKDGYCNSKTNSNVSKSEPKQPKNPFRRHNKHGPKSNTISIVSQVNFDVHRKFINIFINGAPVKLQIDTASDISIVSRDIWEQIGKPVYTPTTHSARNASGDALELAAQFECTVSFNNTNVAAVCFLTNIPNLNLMGIDLISKFGLWDVPLSTVCNQSTICTVNNTTFEEQLKQDFAEIFQPSLGLCRNTKAVLHLKPNVRPVFRPKRPVPFAALPAVNKELDRLEELGVISKVNFSSWAAPIVAIKKPNGAIRVCADFSTGLNSALESHQYPLPLPDDIFATLTGGKFFTNLDLADAYLQIEVEDESKHLLTINTHRGLYQYNRLCFGVKSAPGIFQQVVDTMLAGLQGVVSYLDDIVIVGKSEAEHRNNVVNVLRRIQEWGFHIKPEKCKFLLPSIKYLGVIIDRSGRRPDPEKIATIVQMLAPTDVNTLRSFIGMVAYYGKFIPNMRELRSPLDKLLIKDAKWNWSKECEVAFKRFVTGGIRRKKYLVLI